MPGSTVSAAQATVATMAADSSSAPSAAVIASEYTNPQPVTIEGYTGSAMEPFISRDGQYLFFNSSNDLSVDTNLYYATRINDTTFQFMGQVVGANSYYSSTSIGYVDAVPSMDLNNDFFFMSNRNYLLTLNTLFEGSFNNGTVTSIAPITGNVSPDRLGWFNMDAEISANGQTLYFDNNFVTAPTDGSASKKVSAIEEAVNGPDGFTVLPNSDAIFASVDNDDVNYAPSVSTDGLELFFTRADQTLTTIGIYVATRASTSDPFGTPVEITAVTGYSEAPSISYDGSLLYYCQHLSGGTDAIYVVEQDPPPVACFAAGTRISTVHGPVPVEDLCVGERVDVVTGPHPREVVWIGHRRVDCVRHPKPHLVWPVRISTGACGPDLPRRDLYLSPDHAVFLGDVLIPVKYLINGHTIVQVPMDEVTYYHVELPTHDVMLAEGLPTESFLDTGSRRNFANGGQPTALFPDFSNRVWEAFGIAPLVVSGPILSTIREQLEANAVRQAAIYAPRSPRSSLAINPISMVRSITQRHKAVGSFSL